MLPNWSVDSDTLQQWAGHLHVKRQLRGDSGLIGPQPI